MIGVTTFGCDGRKSGISQYLIQLLKEFNRFPESSSIEVLLYEKEKEIFLPEGNTMQYQLFSDFFQNPVFNIAWHQLVLPGICKRRNYEVLFLSAGNRRLPWKVPCATVGTVHDFSSLHVQSKYNRARHFYITRVLSILIRQLTQVITVSESSKKDIVNYAGVSESRVHVIPNAVDTAFYTVRDPERSAQIVRERYGIIPPYILYISRIEHPGKNHIRLIQAFQELKKREDIPHQLVLAGSDWDRAGEVHAAASSSVYANDIRFTEFVPTGDLPFFYNAADLFIFPSLYEGFGLPILEAMACGVPVACSNLSSMPEVAGDAAVLFDPYDRESMINALLTILTNPSVAQTCRQRGLKRCQTFSWTNSARRTMEILRLAADEARS